MGFKVALVLMGYIMVCMTMPMGAADTPSDKKVLLEHKKLMQKKGIKENKLRQRKADKVPAESKQEKKSSSSNGGRGFFQWLENLPAWVIILILALLALIFYLGLRRTAGVLSWDETGRGPAQPGEREKEGKEKNRDLSFSKAMELAKTGQLGSASIILHKASLLKLQFNHMVPPGEHFTNNQVKSILKSNQETNHIYLPFGRLAAAAERKAFNGGEPGRETFNGLVTLYKETFLKMQGKNE